jgi:hypothetical protein
VKLEDANKRMTRKYGQGLTHYRRLRAQEKAETKKPGWLGGVAENPQLKKAKKLAKTKRMRHRQDEDQWLLGELEFANAHADLAEGTHAIIEAELEALRIDFADQQQLVRKLEGELSEGAGSI